MVLVRERLATVTASVLVALAIGGCQGAQVADEAAPIGQCAGAKCDDATEVAPIAGPEVLRCWLERGTESDPFFRRDALSCSFTERPADYPVAVRMLSAMIRTKGDAKSGAYPAPAPGSDPVVLAYLLQGDYPLSVELSLSLGNASAEGPNVLAEGLGGLTRLDTSFTISGPDALPQSEAHAIALPFELWPVTVVARVAAFQGTLEASSLELGDLSSDGKSSYEMMPRSLRSVRRNQQQHYFIAANATTRAVNGAGVFGSNERKAFVVDGPGIFIAEATGLRRATALELAELGGAASDGGPSSDGGSPADAGQTDGASADGGAAP